MIGKDRTIIKMSETNILNQYSNYLQRAFFELDRDEDKDLSSIYELLLSYEEFKQYYILHLVGKDNFLDGIISDFQFSPN